MKWYINSDGYIVDSQTGDIICLLAKTDDKLRDKIIEIAPELFSAVLTYVDQLDNGKSAVRATYNEFKDILNRIPVDILDDERLNKVA